MSDNSPELEPDDFIDDEPQPFTVSPEEALIRHIVVNLVHDTAQVRLTADDSGRSLVLELKVAKDDMGRVIGRSGRVANAMRDLLRVLSERKRGKNVILEIE